ncbi:MAG TPA: lactonase family protein [Verrucomicrobiae bacterium]|nr:lactonase family protein [Verrucomicrobiae bacterium]
MQTLFRFLAVCAILLIVFPATKADTISSNKFLVYFGTYTGAKSKGIYVSSFDSASGKLSAPELAVETVNPSFLAISPDRQFLFAVNETEHFKGQLGGGVSAFKMDTQTGKLKFLNQQLSGGANPCHIVTDAAGKFVFVANYGSGNMEVLPVQSDGSLGAPVTLMQHHGSSVNKSRQEGPHAHCVALDADNRVYVCDLGLDKVMVYHLETSGELTTNEVPFAQLKPGSGPRHIIFHPDGKYAYVISEMGSTLTAFAYDAKSGALKEIETVSTLPADFHGYSVGAEVAIHPSGKFIYASNRGHNSIAVFAIDEITGRLTLVQHQSTLGKTPRGFAIDPTGRCLIAANQDSDNVVVFHIDESTGKLTETGQSFEVGKPVDVTFVSTK